MGNMKKVIIVGAGPAGLFAANQLAGRFEVEIIEKGKDIDKRDSLLCGVGGAGAFSDGTLNLRPDLVGGNLFEFVEKDEAWNLVRQVDETFLQYGAPPEMQNTNKEGIEKLKLKAASAGAKFIEIPQRHIGSDFAPKVIKSFKENLENRGVKFFLENEVKELVIENNICEGVKLADGKTLLGDYTILAPGRSGFKLVNQWVKQYNIDYSFGPIDIGIRVEVPSIVMKEVTSINRDPKFHIQTPTYDDFVRTFCVNEEGFVTKEQYDGFVTVNGHSFRNHKSGNTNFAFLVHIELTEPLENTTIYGKSIAQLANTIGGKKPILQRMGDLKRGRRSNWERIKRNYVKNTLEDVTPGDISMALPHRIVTDIIEGLEILNKIIPGISSDSTLLYAPEIKFYAICLKTNKSLETSIKNLFAAGDGTGLSRDMVTAAATGIIAARGISNLAQV
jgi:hypothetical protein